MTRVAAPCLETGLEGNGCVFLLKKVFNCSIGKSKCIHSLKDGLEIWHVVICYLNHIFLSSCCLVKESWPSTELSTSSSCATFINF